MNSATAVLSEPADLQSPAEPEYRAMSSSAVAGLALGVLSAIMLGAAGNGLAACLVLAPVPILGIILSTRAITQIRRMPEDYTGGGLAYTGLVLSAFFLVVGVGSGAYIYATEVPDGYQRVSFLEMKPDAIDERGGKVIPDEIQQLAGQRIFIKGYMRPPSQRTNLSSFLLGRDDQQFRPTPSSTTTNCELNWSRRSRPSILPGCTTSAADSRSILKMPPPAIRTRFSALSRITSNEIQLWGQGVQDSNFIPILAALTPYSAL